MFDLPAPLKPILDPASKEPVDPRKLLKQEMSSERFIQIPEQVRDVYRLYRPTPMYRARNFEKSLKTPTKIYYKYEGVSPPGSHRPNTAIAQAYYNMKECVEKLTTETGAGQWGSVLARTRHGLRHRDRRGGEADTRRRLGNTTTTSPREGAGRRHRRSGALPLLQGNETRDTWALGGRGRTIDSSQGPRTKHRRDQRKAGSADTARATRTHTYSSKLVRRR